MTAPASPAAATTILIIRHAEKPDRDGAPGLDAAGQPDERSLTVRGWQRAGSWAALFGAGLGGDLYPNPAVIYAADPTRTQIDRVSRRMAQTVAPLAARLGLTTVTRFAKGEEPALAAELDRFVGVALVCWEHKLIPRRLLPALLGDTGAAGSPPAWDPARFDVVVRLDRTEPGAPWSCRQLLPRLLAGDPDTPMR